MAPGFGLPPDPHTFTYDDPPRVAYVHVYDPRPEPSYYTYTAATNDWCPAPSDDRIKAARRRWLQFTRGNGWGAKSQVTAAGTTSFSRRSCGQIIQPGPRLTRRPKQVPRLYSMKTLRRMGVV